jgi:hypothetical protein
MLSDIKVLSENMLASKTLLLADISYQIISYHITFYLITYFVCYHIICYHITGYMIPVTNYQPIKLCNQVTCYLITQGYLIT